MGLRRAPGRHDTHLQEQGTGHRRPAGGPGWWPCSQRRRGLAFGRRRQRERRPHLEDVAKGWPQARLCGHAAAAEGDQAGITLQVCGRQLPALEPHGAHNLRVGGQAGCADGQRRLAAA